MSVARFLSQKRKVGKSQTGLGTVWQTLVGGGGLMQKGALKIFDPSKAEFILER